MSELKDDIGGRILAIEEFLQETPPSFTRLLLASGLLILALVIGLAELVTAAIPSVLFVMIESFLFLGSGLIALSYKQRTVAWRQGLLEVLRSYLSRLNLISAEVNRFVGAYDEQTRTHYHSMTQTKIRTYFILQEILQKVSSEINVLTQALDSQDYDLIIELTEKILTPMTVRESPMRPESLTIERADLENFLQETSSQLIESTTATLNELQLKT